MHFTPLFLGALAALAPAVQAVGNATVINNCPFPVYLTWVGQCQGPEVTLNAEGGRYIETFTRDPVSGGIALKITRVQGGVSQGAPQTIYAYNLNNGLIWYDLSEVFGSPFAPNALRLAPSDITCPTIFWPSGVSPGGSQVRNCQENSTVTLTLCA
ncbi:hypothetical protein AJ79_10322 [Helicocarpus griseus UAMH5409]|uniref:Bys1 family protein n=1 Tax=Helicocarpus griseus UAMH5409 TaxID=1447875 RepID=A0A2B7WEH1_9EURO|nr:hypothetical protein AJ79_10322 [Helicocarpus griseus UAMH5409]